MRVSTENERIFKMCIVCRKRAKRKGSLFCNICFESRSFESKFTAFQKSKEFVSGVGGKKMYGRLPTIEERLRTND